MREKEREREKRWCVGVGEEMGGEKESEEQGEDDRVTNLRNLNLLQAAVTSMAAGLLRTLMGCLETSRSLLQMWQIWTFCSRMSRFEQ